MRLRERDLEFAFEDALSAIKFDDGTTHATSSVQAVDFVVEYDDHYRFVEVKDPDEPGAANIEAFREKLRSGKLLRSLAGKYRDTRFFHGLQGNNSKEVEYVVLLAMNALDDALLLVKQDELRRSIPFTHSTWNSSSARACVIMSVKQWKRRFGDESIRRLSEATAPPQSQHP